MGIKRSAIFVVECLAAGTTYGGIISSILSIRGRTSGFSSAVKGLKQVSQIKLTTTISESDDY